MSRLILLAAAGLCAVGALTLVPVVRAEDAATMDGGRAGSWDEERMPADVAMDLDFLIAQAWKSEGLEPTPRCSDEEFVRRIYLDVVGTIPTAQQVVDFVKEDSGDKREQLVERLLTAPGYARHFTNLWAEVLVGQGVGDNGREFVPGIFRRWLEDQLRLERPYDELVTEILTASGTVYDSPAVNFSGRRNHSATDLAGAVSKAFLGVQIQCAQCHDHPYEEITQADFNGVAAFWGRTVGMPQEIDYSKLGKRAEERVQRRYEELLEQYTKQGMPEAQAQRQARRRAYQSTRNIQDYESMPEQIEYNGRKFRKRALESRLQKQLGDIAKVDPKFLHGERFDGERYASRRQALASWVTDTANPYTARALANRYWGWFLGRGFVEPVDDFSSVNIPSVPAALDLLSHDTADHGFDLKRLIRIVTRTRAYQLSTATPERTQHRDEFFAAGPLKPLTAQQGFDMLQVALGVARDGTKMSGTASPSAIDMEGRYRGMMDMGRGDVSRSERMLAGAARNYFSTFDDDEGEEQDAFTGTVTQGLFLLNSAVVNNLLIQRNISVIPQIVDGLDGEKKRVRHLFLRTLAREPTQQEMNRLVRFVKRAETVEEDVKDGKGKTNRRRRTAETRRHAAYADVLWALLSSSEFQSNH